MEVSINIFGILLIAFGILSGCTYGNQPVIWVKSGKLDYSKSANVEVTSKVKIPGQELEFLKSDIEKNVDTVFQGRKIVKDSYKVKVEITKYDEGSAFARFMLIGLGQMYLDGTVKVLQGNPPVIIRSGKFEKNYRVGGLEGWRVDGSLCRDEDRRDS